MAKIETASQREDKLKQLSRRIMELGFKFYETATNEQKDALLAMLDDLEITMNAYRNYETSWDSGVIQVTKKIDDVKFRVMAYSSFDSVMDKARGVFAYLSLGA